MEAVPVMWVFWGWVALTLGFFMQGYGRARSLPPVNPASVMRPERITREMRFAELYRQRFGWTAFGYLVLAYGLAGVLLFFAREGNAQVAALFALACLWLIYDHASTPFALRGLDPRLDDALDWIYHACGVLVWVYALAWVGMRYAAQVQKFLS